MFLKVIYQKKTIFITYKSRFVCVKSEKYVYQVILRPLWCLEALISFFQFFFKYSTCTTSLHPIRLLMLENFPACMFITSCTIIRQTRVQLLLLFLLRHNKQCQKTVQTRDVKSHDSKHDFLNTFMSNTMSCLVALLRDFFRTLDLYFNLIIIPIKKKMSSKVI